MIPKSYQLRAVEKLAQFVGDIPTYGLAQAFARTTGRITPQYITNGLPEQLRDIPYVCFRVPTGGGKTLMGAMLLAPVMRTHLQRSSALVVWLTPNTTIRDQTLGRLRDLRHPYREALDAAIGSNVSVISIDEAYRLTPTDLTAQSVVVVATIQSLRQELTEGRRAYADAGELMAHFGGLSPEALQLLMKREDGQPYRSLVNAFAMQRPVVICDEAHSARTPLSFEMFARLAPSAILELTATPETRHDPRRNRFASNVLERVSAAELYQDQMIKLPIELRVRPRWEDALSEALARRTELERIASLSDVRIRPILLIQAERRNESGDSLTAEVIREALLASHAVASTDVVIRTSQIDDLGDTDLLDFTCPIRVVITQSALREGWDCPWAYVLCSMQNSQSATAVEQILGRILRQPGAQWLQQPELNRSYAYVASEDFGTTARTLTDALVDSGFERSEAAVQIVQPDNPALPLFPVTTVPVSEVPSLDTLPAEILQQVTYNDVRGQLIVSGELTAEARALVANAFTSPEVQQAVTRALTPVGRQAPQTANQSAAPKRVPWLSLRVSAGQIETFTAEHFLEEGVRLSAMSSELDEANFPTVSSEGTDGEIMVDRAGRIQASRLNPVSRQFSIVEFEQQWTKDSLVSWLDRNLPYIDIPTIEKVAFLELSIGHLLNRRGVTIQKLGQERYRLRVALETLIDKHRNGALKGAYQTFLFGDRTSALCVSEAHALVLERSQYAYDYAYDGAEVLDHHLFDVIGELGSDGEELNCASRIAAHPNVECWLRNTDGRPRTSFWLQLPSGRFYPDFLAWTRQGRLLVIEYKGTHLYSAEEATLKRNVGSLWERVSGFENRFLMLNGQEWAKLDAFLAGSLEPEST